MADFFTPFYLGAWRFCAALLSLFLAASFLPAFAQQRSGSISVRVTDTDMEEPIFQADVRLYTFGHGGFSFQAYTDGGGRALFNSVPVGAYYIEVTKNGFESARDNVEVTAGSFNDRSLRLKRSSASTSQAPGPSISAAALNIPAPAQKEFDAGKAVLVSDPKTSITHFERAIAQYPKYAEAYLLMALAYLKLNQHEDAVKSVGKAIRADPKFSKAHTLRGRLLMDERDYENALTSLKESLRLGPQEWDAHFELARCYYNIGKMNEAMDEAKQARDLPGSSPLTRLLLADIYLKRNQKLEALAEMDAFVNEEPNNPIAPKVRKKIAALRPPN